MLWKVQHLRMNNYFYFLMMLINVILINGFNLTRVVIICWLVMGLKYNTHFWLNLWDWLVFLWFFKTLNLYYLIVELLRLLMCFVLFAGSKSYNHLLFTYIYSFLNVDFVQKLNIQLSVYNLYKSCDIKYISFFNIASFLCSRALVMTFI